MFEPIILADFYRKMFQIRWFEETVNELYMKGLIPSTLHLYIGQEAVAIGACANLKDSDYLLSTHRPHGYAIAKGVSIKSIMAELYMPIATGAALTQKMQKNG
jgi:pyruvate dehydrogenase E1 component alpha subunit